MNQNQSRQLLFASILAVIGVLWAVLYAYPALNRISEAEKRTESLRDERSGITRALQDYSDSADDRPAPSPNTAAWVTAHALQGLDRNIEINSPYKNGQGAKVKLRSVTAEQVADLLDSMRTVKLILKSFKLEDADGDGRWNLEFMVEVAS